MEKNPKIICAATKVEYLAEDKYLKSVVICSPRHWDVIAREQFKVMNISQSNVKSETQGFVDQYGDFYTREQAWIIADKNKQIVRRVGGDHEKLFSENLY
jgi:hypothetical protein